MRLLRNGAQKVISLIELVSVEKCSAITLSSAGLWLALYNFLLEVQLGLLFAAYVPPTFLNEIYTRIPDMYPTGAIFVTL